jgi:hypothetical protein
MEQKTQVISLKKKLSKTSIRKIIFILLMIRQHDYMLPFLLSIKQCQITEYFTTADLWDENETLLSCVDLFFNHFGNKKVFRKITTIKLFEDNSLVRTIRT